ncbi:MAG: 6-phosphofructokinase, partial [Bacteroidetes bacterium]|nr:6-phosphofructokinase [Bacteroidota bacterium]
LNEGLRTTAYSHERIIVVESMGMHAGWLALSSSMGHPDFIIIPEFTLDYPSFVKKVVEKYSKQKNLIIVVAEGARWSDGSYISANENEKDSFGHPRFKGAANLLAEKIKNDLKDYFDTRNVNSVNPSYLYRSGKPNKLDISAATKLGAAAVRHLKHMNKQSIFLTTNFDKEKLEIAGYPITDVENIDHLHRFVTDQFYDPTKLNVTKYGKRFLSKIVDEFPIVNYRL